MTMAYTDWRERIVQVFELSDVPAMTIGDIADTLGDDGPTRQSVHRVLVEKGKAEEWGLESGKVGNATAYWWPEGDEDTPTHDEIFEDIDLALRMLQGARMAAAHQHAQQGDLEDAVKRAGEANGYRVARRMVNDYREEGELPEFTGRGHWKAYAEMIDAFDKADEAVKEVMDGVDDDAGPPTDPGAY